MKKEEARELLEKFYRHVNDKNGKLTVTWDDVETFLSTLPDEKEDCQRCKYYHPPIITEPCFSCVEKLEFNPSK